MTRTSQFLQSLRAQIADATPLDAYVALALIRALKTPTKSEALKVIDAVLDRHAQHDATETRAS